MTRIKIQPKVDGILVDQYFDNTIHAANNDIYSKMECKITFGFDNVNHDEDKIFCRSCLNLCSRFDKIKWVYDSPQT